MGAGENPGAGSPREPYQQLVRTIVEQISNHVPVETFYSVVVAHEGKTFVAAVCGGWPASCTSAATKVLPSWATTTE